MPGGGFGRFALKAQTVVNGPNVSLSAAHVELDGNSGDGVLAFSNDQGRTLQATLAAEGLDVTPYTSTLRVLVGGDRSWNPMPIALQGFNAIDVDLRLSAARVTLANAKLGRTAIGASLRGGNFNVTIGESQAFGGTLKGSFGLARSATAADLKAQLQFTDVDLDQCLGEILGIRRIEGKGTLSFNIDSTGSSIYELAKAVNGNATLMSRRGAITGLNVEQLLKRLERNPLAGRGDLRSGKTPYDLLAVSFKVMQGIATVDDVRIEAPAMRLLLAGSASIPARDLDLKGTATLLASTDAAPIFELPFVVQGPWDDPLMLPDPQILIKRSGAAAPLLDALKNRAR
jgi:AsmA protein